MLHRQFGVWRSGTDADVAPAGGQPDALRGGERSGGGVGGGQEIAVGENQIRVVGESAGRGDKGQAAGGQGRDGQVGGAGRAEVARARDGEGGRGGVRKDARDG